MLFLRGIARSSASSSLLSLQKQPLRFTPSIIRLAHDHHESHESLNQRYESFFNSAEDLFELQRGLNNIFAYDAVPTVSTVEAAVRAARRLNDYSTAVRIFEGVKEKVENKSQYDAYLKELTSLRQELGVETKEELYKTN